MSNFWKVDLSLSTISAYNKRSKQYVTVPVTSIPSIYAICVQLVSTYKELPTDGREATGPYHQPKGPTYGYRLPALPAPLVDRIFVKEGVKTDFHKAKISGEICMSDFTVTNVECTRPAFRWNGAYNGFREFDAAFSTLLGVAGYTLIPDDDPVWKMNYSLNRVRFYYRYYTQDGSNFSYAPLPNLLGWSTLNHREVDVATVTSNVANANQGYWDALSEFGELPETIGFIRDCLRSVLTLSKGFSDQIKSGIRTLRVHNDLPLRFGKEASEKWLQYRYAVKPIAYSISDLRDVFKAWLDRIYRDERTYLTEPVTAPEMDGYTLNHETIDVYHRCTIRDRYDAASFSSKMMALVGTNPFVTAYELTKLSFVLDWFVNIGDFIAATTSWTTYAERKACYSWKMDAAVIYTPTSGDGPIAYVLAHNYKRVVINPIDHVGLTTDVFLNWKRQLDAIALTFAPLTKHIRGLK